MSSSIVLTILESVIAESFKDAGEAPLTHEEFRRAVNGSAVDPMDFVEVMRKKDLSLLSPIAKKLTIWILERRDNRKGKN